MQIDMSPGAVVPLPPQPLSLLPYEESAFYVRSVYYTLRDIVKTQTGAYAVQKLHPVPLCCKYVRLTCSCSNAVQRCTFCTLYLSLTLVPAFLQTAS